MNAAVKEQLRQEGEAFDLNKRQAECWFVLRLCMGYGAFGLLLCVFGVCMFVLIDHAAFPSNLVYAAMAALVVDLLGFAVAAWKMVLDPATAAPLKPVTGVHSHAAPAP